MAPVGHIKCYSPVISGLFIYSRLACFILLIDPASSLRLETNRLAYPCTKEMIDQSSVLQELEYFPLFISNRDCASGGLAEHPSSGSSPGTWNGTTGPLPSGTPQSSTTPCWDSPYTSHQRPNSTEDAAAPSPKPELLDNPPSWQPTQAPASSPTAGTATSPTLEFHSHPPPPSPIALAPSPKQAPVPAPSPTQELHNYPPPKAATGSPIQVPVPAPTRVPAIEGPAPSSTEGPGGSSYRNGIHGHDHSPGPSPTEAPAPTPSTEPDCKDDEPHHQRNDTSALSPRPSRAPASPAQNPVRNDSRPNPPLAPAPSPTDQEPGHLRTAYAPAPSPETETNGTTASTFDSPTAAPSPGRATSTCPDLAPSPTGEPVNLPSPAPSASLPSPTDQSGHHRQPPPEPQPVMAPPSMSPTSEQQPTDNSSSNPSVTCTPPSPTGEPGPGPASTPEQSSISSPIAAPAPSPAPGLAGNNVTPAPTPAPGPEEYGVFDPECLACTYNCGRIGRTRQGNSCCLSCSPGIDSEQPPESILQTIKN